MDEQNKQIISDCESSGEDEVRRRFNNGEYSAPHHLLLINGWLREKELIRQESKIAENEKKAKLMHEENILLQSKNILLTKVNLCLTIAILFFTILGIILTFFSPFSNKELDVNTHKYKGQTSNPNSNQERAVSKIKTVKPIEK